MGEIMMDLSVIIVAGGKGLRMQSVTPKQYLMLHVKPILAWTIEHIHNALLGTSAVEYILVRPKEDDYYCSTILTQYISKEITLKYADGGKSRAESVSNGLAIATGKYVLIHDGVRPFISSNMMSRLLQHKAEGSVIPAIAPTDSIRMVEGSKSKAIDRNEVRLVQTPQLFERVLLEEAYADHFEAPDASLTDDASIVEHYKGVSPVVVEGWDLNIKITTPKDMAVAEWIIKLIYE